MACVPSPELDDQALLAYIDGNARPEIQRHIEQCPRCQQRVAELAALENQLTARLYRALCPTPHELGEYHLGMLPPAEAKAIGQHLAECPHCAREREQLADYLARLEQPVETSPLDRIREGVRVLVAKLVSSGPGIGLPGQPALAPAFAGIRGEERESCVYQADGIQVVIGIQADAEQPGSKAILGLVMGLALSEVKAQLWQAKRLVATVPVDELGNFEIPGLAPGSYELFISGPDLEIHIQNLETSMN